MSIDPKIKQMADNIRTKIYGKDVRDSLATGLESMSEDVVSNEARQTNVETQFQAVIDETTGKDVINGPEIIAARNGKSNLKTRLDDEHAQVTAQLQHMEIEVFNEIPSTTQLKEGKFGFVIDVAQQKYDELNLSFEDLNVNGFPKGFTNYPSGTGLPINETHLSTIASTDGTFRSQRLGMVGGVDGSSNYSRLRSAIVIPLNNSRLIKKSDLMNFRFSIKPLSNGCFDGNGKHFGALDVSFRDSENQVLGNSLTTHFIYDSFVLPGNTKDSKVPGNEWSIIKWDLYSHIKETSINFDAVENIALTFLAYTNHSSASVEYLIDDISFGV